MDCSRCIAQVTLLRAQTALYTTWAADVYTQAQRDMAAAAQLCRELRVEGICADCLPNSEIKLTRTGAARSEVGFSDEAQPVLLEA